MEKIDTEKRKSMMGVGAIAFTSAISSLSNSSEAKEITPDSINDMEGYWVQVDHLLQQEVPVPNREEHLGKPRGLIISKRFHRFWLFDKGKLVHTGPTGTAATLHGYKTPVGKFKVTRKESDNYMSGQYPSTDGEPNMPWAVFFNRGIAFHGSKNFQTKNGKLFLHLDNSHGCANATKEDAKLVNSLLRVGDPVTVLP